MNWFRAIVPLFVPGMILTATLGLAVARPLSRRLDGRPWLAYLLFLSLGLIVSATLTPLVGALEDGVTSTGTCDMTRLGLAPLGSYLRTGDAGLNVVLFVPLGLALGLLRGRTSPALPLLAFLLPPAIELTQMLVPALGRGCEAADIIDNMLGLAFGLGVGLVIRRFMAARGQSRDQGRSSTSSGG